MPGQAKRAVAQRAPQSRPPSRLGVLPEWNLADLYAGTDDPQVKGDLDRAAAESLAFEETYKGKLAALAKQADAGSAMAAAVKRYEALDDLLGRLASYASLLHAGDTVDPARAKFYADVEERVTAASTHLLFFTLELNRLDDAKLEAAMQDRALAHYRPWIEDLRKDKPYQLEDRVEQLFHEKSVTGYSAWNRLFDETIASLRFKVGSKSLAIEPTLNLMQDPRAAMRKAAPQALPTVLGGYGALSPDMAAIAERFFSDNWIDAPVRPGKAPGAFSHPTVPSAHPYLLLNYQGRPRDVMTLAHELGHGVHQVLAAPKGALMAPTPLTLAETASVFGEMLTFKTLLAKADREQRKTMLAAKVQDMINTVVRQIAFYTFERHIHMERRSGELTVELLNALWLEVQRESLGEAIELKSGYEVFWAYISHFVHSPFYVYAYAFGDCLVNSLYAVYEGAAEGFAERYLEMLAAGGTQHHSQLLAPFGLYPPDPAVWEGGLGVIERMIDELEELD